MPAVRTFTGGNVTARDPSSLTEHETIESTGAYYKPGDPMRAHKLGGRSTFGDTGSAAEVKGMALCLFDSDGTDRLLAFSGTTLYSATPSKTGTFASLEAGVTGDTLGASHANDEWYLCTGKLNRVLKSDGSLRPIGVQRPLGSLAATQLTVGSETPVPAASSTSTLLNYGLAYDGNYDTGASANVYQYEGTSVTTQTETYSWSADTPPGTPRVNIHYDLSGNLIGQFGVPIVWKANLKIEVSIDTGATYTTELDTDLTSPTTSVFQHLASGLADNDELKVRVTLTLDTAYHGVVVTLYVKEVNIIGESSDNAAVSSGGTLRYAACQYDQTNVREGPRSEVVPIAITGSVGNGVKLDFTGLTAVDSETTHWRVYRTAFGGTDSQLGELVDVPVDQDYYVDDFSTSVTTQPAKPYPLLAIAQPGKTPLYFDQNEPPPSLRRIKSYGAHLIGFSDNDKRAMWYCMPGRYESWPTIYSYSSFPLEEHDELRSGVQVGSSFIIGAEAAMIRMDSLPQNISGTFVGKNTVIQGAPGLVGDDAITRVLYEGDQAAAWVAYNGVWVTNGHSADRISDDIDWSEFEGRSGAGWVLFWDLSIYCLVFAYSSTSTSGNDRYYLIHMDRAHRNERGQPKWTGPHYGKVNHLVAGQIDNSYRRYSAHPTDGKVYLENDASTGLDSSNALDSSGTHRLKLKGGKRYEGWEDWTALDARLRHTDFGTGQTCSVGYEVGRDASGYSETKTQNVSLAGHTGTQLEFGRSGEWHQVSLTHDGQGIGAVQDLMIEVQRQGRSGAQKGAA